MAPAPSRPMVALLRLLPAPIRRKFEGETGQRFARFVLVALAAVIATQIALVIFLDGADMGAGTAGGLAAVVGAAVSYVLSRWAWERKGRPHLLKETLPFWAISIGVGIVLTLASKFGNSVAMSMGLAGAKRVAVAQSFYLLANAATFAVRFLIFHYVLFAGPRSAPVPPISPSKPGDDAEPFVMAGDSCPPERTDPPADRR